MSSFQKPVRTFLPRFFFFFALLMMVQVSSLSSANQASQTELVDSIVAADDLDIVSIIDGLNDIRDWKDRLEDATDFPDNYFTCLQRGYSADYCALVAGYCAIRDELIRNLPGIQSAFLDELQLFDIFAIDCGNGECYQCCHVPGQGCHSSFVGFPVINCNGGYGPGTNPAGLTLLLDGEVGDSCLVTPQTCEHIPKCIFPGFGGDQPLSQPVTLSDSENPLLSDPAAIARRARSFADDMLKQWRLVLDSYASTSKPLTSLTDFVTGRGCSGWRSDADQLLSLDFNNDAFVIRDEDGNRLSGPSKLNALQQLGIMRALASIPNLSARLEYVESRTWNDAQKQRYLRRLGANADRVLLRYMDPVVLSLLKNVTTIQDYRLLAVPLDNEDANSQTYAGCEPGTPPNIFASYDNTGSLGISLDLAFRHSGETHQSPTTVFWGDGTSDRFDLNIGGRRISLDHTYAESGRYMIIAMTENDSGLRGITSLPVAVNADRTPDAENGESIPRKIRLKALQQRTSTTSGNVGDIQFKVLGRTREGQDFPLAYSRTLREQFNEDMDFGDVTGFNVSGEALTHIIVSPFQSKGFEIGLRDKVFSLQKFQLEFFNTAGPPIIREFSARPQRLRAFDVNGNEVDPTTFETDPNGRLLIPWRTRDMQLERVEIEIPEHVIASARSPSLNAAVTLPVSQSWVEKRPDVWQSAGLRPGVADLIYPNGSGTSAAPEFSWFAVGNATHYQLVVEGENGRQVKRWLSAEQTGCELGKGVCSAKLRTPSEGTNQWKIQTRNDAGTGRFSDTKTFVTGLPFTSIALRMLKTEKIDNGSYVSHLAASVNKTATHTITTPIRVSAAATAVARVRNVARATSFVGSVKSAAGLAVREASLTALKEARRKAIAQARKKARRLAR